MPFCPQCRVEYVPGIKQCKDCDVPLVDALPPEGEDKLEGNIRGYRIGTKGFFLKLFGNPTERKVRQIIKKTEREVEKELRPLKDIGLSIIKASDYCFKSTKTHIDTSNVRERQELEIYVFYEFIYFFMHMTMRTAFSQLNEQQIVKLQEYLSPVVVGTAVDTFCMHWPDDLKKKIMSDVYERLNDAEIEYSSCKEMISTDKPFTGDALFSKLARNVAELTGNSMNPIVMADVNHYSIHAYVDMKLEQLVRRASKVL